MHVIKNKLPPGTDPKYSQPKFLPVQENILPYKKPDWYETPADMKECTPLWYSAGGANINSKTQQQMSLLTEHNKTQVRQEKASKDKTIIK
jgi:hypothetical protein